MIFIKVKRDIYFGTGLGRRGFGDGARSRGGCWGACSARGQHVKCLGSNVKRHRTNVKRDIYDLKRDMHRSTNVTRAIYVKRDIDCSWHRAGATRVW